MSSFSALLRSLREQKNFTQAQLAEKAGVSLQTLASWEQGIRSPSWKKLQQLCAALGVSADAFEQSAKAEPSRGRGRPPKPVKLAGLGKIRLVGVLGAGPAVEDALDEEIDVPGIFGDGIVAYMVRGRSMEEDLIGSGDYIIVRTQPEPESGDRVAAWIEGSGNVLKHLHVARGERWLMSAEKGQREKFHKLTDDDRVYGVYVGVIRKKKR